MSVSDILDHLCAPEAAFSEIALCSVAFLSPLAPLLGIHWPLATVLSLPPHQRGQVVRGLFPAGYCHPGKGVSDLVFGFSWCLVGSVDAVGERQPPNLENTESTSKRGKPTIVSSVFHRAEPCIRAQSLGRVRDPVRIADGPTAIDAATQRRHFGFRLRLVGKLQPIGGGSGRGHPLSGTRETWMVANVLNPVQRIRGGRGGIRIKIKIRIKGSARGHPLSGERTGPPTLWYLGNVDDRQCHGFR